MLKNKLALPSMFEPLCMVESVSFTDHNGPIIETREQMNPSASYLLTFLNETRNLKTFQKSISNILKGKDVNFVFHKLNHEICL